MDARSKTSTVLPKTFLLLLALIVIVILLMNAKVTSSIARAQGERVFENAISKEVPIKVRVKKEKEASFRNMKNEKWVREFELEVTNSGDKPIYFLFLDLITDVKLGGDPLEFSLVYGRAELGDIVSKARTEDEPIAPGSTYVFKIHPGQVPAWEQSVREARHTEASKIRLKIESLSFGDGTGYLGNHAYPPAGRLQPTQQNHARGPNRSAISLTSPHDSHISHIINLAPLPTSLDAQAISLSA